MPILFQSQTHHNRLTILLPGLALALVLAALGLAPIAQSLLFLMAMTVAAQAGYRDRGLLALAFCGAAALHALGIIPSEHGSTVSIAVAALGFGWTGSGRTDLQEPMESLTPQEDEFRRILINLPDIAWTADQNGRIVYISPKIEDVLGFSSEEIKQCGAGLFRERLRPRDLPRLQDAFFALFSSRRILNEEFEIQSRDGRWNWVLVRAIRLYERDGVTFTDGVITDITQRKQIEVDLQWKTAFLEAQVNSTIDGILVVNDEGRWILHNHRMLEIFRVPVELLEDRDDRVLLSHVLPQIKNAEAFLKKVEYLYSHPDESGRDEVELTDGTILDRYSAPVVDQGGKHYGRIWSFRDVTKRRRDEDMLRLLSAAVEQSPTSVLITDPLGTITYVNRKFLECSGYTIAEVVGRNPRILNSGNAPRETYQRLWNTILDGKEWRGEFRNKKKNGDIYWESAAISPVFDQSGAISHFLAVKEDITERRRLESELRQAQKLEGIGQLAAGIAHEINTPTQFVMDNLSFLQESWGAIFTLLKLYRATVRGRAGAGSGLLTSEICDAESACDLEFTCDEVPKAIAQSIDGARRVANIVRAMKEFSHPDAADKVESDLNKNIASTITVARNEWKYVATVATDFDESLPLVVCYPGDINQVVLNLIVNAAHSIKARVREGEKGEITIRSRAQGKTVEIAVSDTGTGIAEEIRGRIFEPFFTTKEVGQGTGQGLSFAHSVVVKKHRGRIWFESEVGKGTTFFVQLPISPTVS